MRYIATPDGYLKHQSFSVSVRLKPFARPVEPDKGQLS